MHAHVQAIPFENLDVLLGRGSISCPSALAAQARPRTGRGGYCFEQNGLLLLCSATRLRRDAAQRARSLPASPRLHAGPDAPVPAASSIDGVAWLADVGVGGAVAVLRPPARGRRASSRRRTSRAGDPRGRALFHQVAARRRVARRLRVHAARRCRRFDRDWPNWYTSAHPASHFKTRLLAARALPDGGRLTLTNRELSVRVRGEAVQTRMLDTPEDLLATLAEQFGLRFEPGTTFECAALDWPIG